MAQCEPLTHRVAQQLRAAGLDIAHPFCLRVYNDALPKAVGACIPAQGAAGEDALCLLIANTKSIWEPFLAACCQQPDLLASNDPLDHYIEGHVGRAVELCAPGLRRRIFFSHQRTSELVGGSEFVAFQRMAHAAGLAHLDESCHLSIHPRYGTWLSLRACVVFDDLAYDGAPPSPPPNPLAADPATRRYVQMTMLSAVHSTSKQWHLQEADVEAAAATLLDTGNEEAHGSDGTDFDLPDMSAAAASNGGGGGAEAGSGQQHPSRGSATSSGSRRASLDSTSDELPSMHAVRKSWRKWLAVRDAPCPGHFWRFSDEMAEYHYTAQRGVLMAALRRRGMLPAPASPDRVMDATAIGVGSA